jgi:hypothetical protein
VAGDRDGVRACTGSAHARSYAIVSPPETESV